MERVHAEMARTIAGRYPDRARTFRVLFSDRHLHHPEHCLKLAVVDLLNLPALSGSASPKTMARNSPKAQYCRIMARLDRRKLLNRHVRQLLQCRRCSRMKSTPVSGGAILSDVMIIGQAPGPREPVLQRPFAHTAGQTLFRWLEECCGVNEALVRSRIYFAAVCRCFPGKNSGGTDRVPAPDEIRNCSSWLDNEIRILRPCLIIPVGRLAIVQFIECSRLEKVVGRKFRVERAQHRFDLIPLPHPSGASPWHKISPGKQLLKKAIGKIDRHPAIRELKNQSGSQGSNNFMQH